MPHRAGPGTRPGLRTCLAFAVLASFHLLNALRPELRRTSCKGDATKHASFRSELWASMQQVRRPPPDVARGGRGTVAFPKLSCKAQDLSAAKRFETRGVSNICPARTCLGYGGFCSDGAGKGKPIFCTRNSRLVSSIRWCERCVK